MDGSFNISGAKELDDLLKLLPEKIARKLADNAVRAGGNLLKKKVEDKAPGKIKKAIFVRKNQEGTSSVNYQIGTTKSAPEAHLVEFGTKAHKIVAGTKRGNSTGKKVLSNRKIIFGKTVNHPGAHTKPFFRPALDESHAEYMQKMASIMARGLAREAKRYSR